MTFFHTREGMIYPTSDILWIGRSRQGDDGLWSHSITLRGDDYDTPGRTVSKAEVERILEIGAPIMPAEPETKLVVFVAHEALPPSEWGAYTTPIIGWKIIDGQPHPITIEDRSFSGSSYTAIVLPSGEIIDATGERWPVIAAFEESARGWAEADIAEQKQTQPSGA